MKRATMQMTDEMRRGWEFAVGTAGADVGARMGEEYVAGIEEAIRQLEHDINCHSQRNQAISQLQGFMLEEWSAGTFNVGAAAAGSSDHATVLHSRLKNSVDIKLDSGVAYGAKSYATAAETAREQAGIDPDTRQARYHDQQRLVPSDQLEGARDFAQYQANNNASIQEDVANAYRETKGNLTDRIKNDGGIESRPATRKELDQMARESKSKDFSAERHGLTVRDVIKSEYLLKQALKAGYTTAAITVAFQLAPEIYKAIDYLIRTGELNPDQLKLMGKKAVTAGAEGFLRGFISASILIVCESGVLGEAFKNISPPLLGTAVALVLQTAKNSILVAAGRMSARQMGTAFVDSIVISGGYLAASQVGGLIGTALGFECFVAGYLIGSLVGTAFCAMYGIGKKKLISFCVDTGFACFGLVEQNYELPVDVLEELGIETAMIPRTCVNKSTIPRVKLDVALVERTGCETIEFTVLRRGIIAVNTVGYVM